RQRDAADLPALRGARLLVSPGAGTGIIGRIGPMGPIRPTIPAPAPSPAARQQTRSDMPSFTTNRTVIVVLAAAAALLRPAARAAESPGYSGMVRIADNTFLTVNDRKNPIQPGARLGVLTVTPRDGVIFYPLHVRDWVDAEKEPSDLEACCAVPGRPSE